MNPHSGKAFGVDLAQESAAGEEDPGASLDGFDAVGASVDPLSSTPTRSFSMTHPADHLMDWLRDAHAMEEQAETMLQTASDRLQNYPELKAKMQAHLQETREQARMLRECIQRRGGDTSSMKDVAGKMSAMMQGLGARMADDEVMKVAMSCYAFEHFEVATYRILVAAAEMAQDTQTRQVCEDILRQEEATAAWLGERLGVLTQEFLVLSQGAGAEAKR
ncbi:ferritin-like domain-containing protein [Pseudacidovorax intermedius]|uniref:ferritin-like domain-containing protein n=1 Tax=Pseudacidovorax intermedius TaxID=433924 RepID=UPI00034C4ACC|nr:ferritin-like domain-containing protein [Pseudacidovorax intermedius]